VALEPELFEVKLNECVDDAHLKNTEESILSGSVTYSTYWNYWNAGKSSIGLLILAISFVGTQVLITSTDIWLSIW